MQHRVETVVPVYREGEKERGREMKMEREGREGGKERGREMEMEREWREGGRERKREEGGEREEEGKREEGERGRKRKGGRKRAVMSHDLQRSDEGIKMLACL